VPSMQSATTEKLKEKRADKAEQRLVSLSWTVTAAENDSGEWKATKGAPLDADNKPMAAAVRSDKIDPKQR